MDDMCVHDISPPVVYLLIRNNITPMGEALANAYIRGKEPTIPPIY